jgi:hypothetical protein
MLFLYIAAGVASLSLLVMAGALVFIMLNHEMFSVDGNRFREEVIRELQGLRREFRNLQPPGSFRTLRHSHDTIGSKKAPAGFLPGGLSRCR